jgi:putative DNA primase/helicase
MSASVKLLLDKIGDQGARRSGDSYLVQCPGHDDNRRSLAIKAGERGAILKCHAGCDVEAIVERLGLKMADLFDGPPPERERSRLVATYDSRDEKGVLLYQALRYEPKDFRQRAANGSWSLAGVRRVLYRLPELLASAPRAVFIAEGEKDVDALAKLGLIATTNAGGAGKWRTEYGEALRGRPVFILPDNDEPGAKHAQQVAASLVGIASSAKIVMLPGLPQKGDVSDWLAAGGTKEALFALVKAPAAPALEVEALRARLAKILDEVEAMGRLINGGAA